MNEETSFMGYTNPLVFELFDIVNPEEVSKKRHSLGMRSLEAI